jgi:hypothetical protein
MEFKNTKIKLFKLFNKFNSEKKLPTKEYLYEEFYRRTQKPSLFRSRKFYNENHERLGKIEVDNIKNLIDNYPNFQTHNIEKTSDFTLDCIIPEVLYKVRATKKGWGDIGLVHIKEDALQFYYSNTELRDVSTWNSGKKYKDRIEIKEEILELVTNSINI